MTAAELLGRVTAEVSEAIEGMFNNFLGGVMGTIQKEKGIKERRLLKKQVIDMIELTHVSAQRLYVDFDRKLEWSNRVDSIFNEGKNRDEGIEIQEVDEIYQSAEDQCMEEYQLVSGQEEVEVIVEVTGMEKHQVEVQEVGGMDYMED